MIERGESLEMDLRTLFGGIGVEAPSLDVPDMTTDSREAVNHGLFLACGGGAHHGLDFLDTALAAGIVAVAWEPGPQVREPQLPEHVIGLRVPALRSHLGNLANRFFATPSEQLEVIGVTGTNGKTTTAWLTAQALSLLGVRAAYMGTLGYGVYPTLAPSELTTPGCIQFHRRLRELSDAGARFAVAEISSHALAQGRTAGVRFRAAAFTNLSRDHLDYHADLPAYGAAKARLFTDAAPACAVINTADAFGAELSARLSPGTRLISVRAAQADRAAGAADVVARVVEATGAGLRLAVSGAFGEAELSSPLWGRFNAENLVVALGLLLAEGFELPAAVSALGACTAPPGRMQRIDSGARQPMVLVDFAHSPDALRLALAAAREHCNGEVWCVFGCGGDRDRGKRGPMGGVASEFADHVVLTDDNPRNEDPRRIIDDILEGVDELADAEVLPDRAAAIEFAIRAAQPGDAVVIAGKGHETTQISHGQSRAFSDVALARSILGQRS